MSRTAIATWLSRPIMLYLLRPRQRFILIRPAPQAPDSTNARRRQPRQQCLEREPDGQKLVVAMFRHVESEADRQPGLGEAGRQRQTREARGAAGAEVADEGAEGRRRRAVEVDGV